MFTVHTRRGCGVPRRDMVMPELKCKDVSGWKAICEYLGVKSAETARKRLKRLGITISFRHPVLNTEVYEERSRLASLGCLDDKGNQIKQLGGKK
jgi:hypothetical protein